MRLNRFLAACGLGSRRASEELVHQGRVFLNGEPVVELGVKVGPDDVVIVDGKRVRPAESVTVILNKPPGYLCSRVDELEESRETIYDLLPEHFRRLHYVGRLDKDSEGLLILTSSGELTEQLTHPKHGVEKEYLVALDRVFEAQFDAPRLLEGFPIEGGFARANLVEVEAPRVVALVLTQGIKRQIRFMFEALGYRVQRLQRVRIGSLVMPALETGRWRVLSEREVAQLLTAHKKSGAPRPTKPAKSLPRRNLRPEDDRERNRARVTARPTDGSRPRSAEPRGKRRDDSSRAPTKPEAPSRREGSGFQPGPRSKSPPSRAPRKPR